MPPATAHLRRACLCWATATLCGLAAAQSAGEPGAAAGAAAVSFDRSERAQIASLSLPSQSQPQRDPSNALDGQSRAIELGRWLFFKPALSRSGQLACATCHQSGRQFQDGLPTPTAAGSRGQRNTPSLLDSADHRWWGWGGEHDSLWAASLAPLTAPGEMATSAAHVRRLLQHHPQQQRRLTQLHRQLQHRAARQGRALPDADEALLVTLAKALAAYQATLRSPATPFDAFAQGLAKNDAHQVAPYPVAAQRGLKLFIGEGRCLLCHGGPRFSNGEFADIGLPFFLPGGGVDGGRHAGLRSLLQERARFNRLGPYADDTGQPSAKAAPTRHVVQEHRHFGEFRVPGLRGVAQTAPYMHNGSLATLHEVLRHYSDLNEERLHADGERILRPLRWSPAQIDDVLAFLNSLSPRQPR